MNNVFRQFTEDARPNNNVFRQLLNESKMRDKKKKVKILGNQTLMYKQRKMCVDIIAKEDERFEDTYYVYIRHMGQEIPFLEAQSDEEVNRLVNTLKGLR